MNPFEIWLFGLPPLATITIIAFCVTLFTSLVYKFVTDQELMKSLKGELKELQDLMKQHKETPEKLMEIQKEAMEKNMEYMKHSMRPTFFTMIPIILLFGWLNTHIGYDPIMPDAPFEVWAEFKDSAVGVVSLSVSPEDMGLEILTEEEVTISEGKASWQLQGSEGEYVLEYSRDGTVKTQPIMITTERTYKKPVLPAKGSDMKTLNIGNTKVQPLAFLGIGWSWIWIYILASIGFGTAIRKILGVK